MIAERSVRADGRTVAFLEAGPSDGPVVVLLHGLASDSGTWDRAISPLAAHGLHVIAVDLLGHGRSDKPDPAQAGYLLDDFSASLAALLDALALPAATVCGHSLGGAVAMHFGAQHPERLQRLVLVAAGGLGREVHLMLRAGSLPVAPIVVRWALGPRLRRWYGRPRVHRLLRLTEDNVTNLRRAGRALGTPAGQGSFFASLRGVIEPGGQRGSFLEMRALAPGMPTLLVWNEGDPVIPVTHARAAAEYLSNARLVVFRGNGHEPHRREPQRFADEVARFVLRG